MRTAPRIQICVIFVIYLIAHTRSAVNMAAGKSASQSSIRNDNRPNRALDGCVSPTDSCCSLTKVGVFAAWWRVDLGQLVSIDRIHLYNAPNWAYRFAGYHLYVSNTTNGPQGRVCYKENSAMEDQVPENVIHECPYVARYVSVHNYRNKTKKYDWQSLYAFTELCEVEVFGCQLGFYGNGSCNLQCSEKCLGGNCNPTTGNCFDCVTGKKGDFCNESCPVGCKDVCDKYTGFCEDCVTGKMGDFCNESCPVGCKDVCDRYIGLCADCVTGKMGDFCNESCPVGCKDVCDRYTGFCADCVTGNMGDFCNESCPVGCKDVCDRYTGLCADCITGKMGDYCNESCPVGCKDVCDRYTGLCADCVTGKKGDFCNESCPVGCKDVCDRYTGFCADCIPGKHGGQCQNNCSINCENRICEKETSVCSACEKGYYEETCSSSCEDNCMKCLQNNGTCTECHPGFYGHNCSTLCGNCETCDISTGLCTSDCISGFEGTSCEKVMHSPQSTNSGGIAGASVSSLLAVAIGVIVIFIIIKRRRRFSDKEDEVDVRIQSSNSLYNVEEDTLKDSSNSENNKYVNINEAARVYMNTSEVDTTNDLEENIYCNSDSAAIPVEDLRSVVDSKMKNKGKAFTDEYNSLPTGAVHPHEHGKLPKNIAKNRFKSIFPYDHSRVILKKLGNDSHSDYINANYIDSVTKGKEYIAAQGPKAGTVTDFWRMTWEQQTGKIVMVTNLFEEAKKKCEKYWPDEGETLSTELFDIKLDRERKYAFYTVRDITITQRKTKTVRIVHQFHYTNWPDHGTPDPNELVVFHRRVKLYYTSLPGKMIVHCSAGIGRTGTFIALDALVQYGKETGNVDVLEYAKRMRKDRMNMIQTSDQYIFLHQGLLEAFGMPDTLISKTNFHLELATLSNGTGPANQTKLREEFQLLQVLKPEYREGHYKTALNPENKNKNRTPSILPVDKFRAYLRSHTEDRTDFINALILPSYTAMYGYIITQTPLPDTVVDVLTMVMDHNCEAMVVIDNENIEWLPEEGKLETIGEFTLTQKDKPSTIPTVNITEVDITNETHNFNVKVHIFHLTSWNRGCLIPNDQSSLLQFLELVDSRRKSGNTKPTVVMCWDGCTHSGLFCGISNARDQIKLDEEVDIFQTVRQLTVRRPECMSAFEQYQYCYNIIKTYLETTDVYVN